MSKLILVLNCGSSSLKFALIDPINGQEHLTGLAECLHLPEARIKWNLNKKHEAPLNQNSAHFEAIQFIVDDILASEPNLSKNIFAIGHRVVHGGEKFTKSVLINDEVIAGIQECASLAPLHNPAHIIGIEAAMKAFPNLPNVAVFDTAFHQTMPESSFLYALPYNLYKNHGVRRYGMHGTSHLYIARQMATKFKKPISELNIISCHLGNGASVCAIKDGESVDTSMGMTPLEGLVMGTRSGDIDPAIVFFLYNQLGYSVEDIEKTLTKESGLLGLTEKSSDCRYLGENYDKTEDAKRTMDVMTHRLAKYIASYFTLFDKKIDAITFTGGIGENSLLTRQKTLSKLSLLGIKIDDDLNSQCLFGNQGVITSDDSQIPCYVIATNEELVIAEDTLHLANIKN